VRYLEQGNVSLVMEALKEAAPACLRNAPHLVRELGFCSAELRLVGGAFLRLGLKLYDVLAGKYGFGASRDPLQRGDLDAADHPD